MAMGRVLVLEHHPLEHAGAFGEALREGGANLKRVRLYAGESIPAVSSSDALLIMGGPMSVRDQNRYPWIKAEIALVQQALAKDIPLLGLCLGSQIIAAAAGSNLVTGPAAEIGWYPIRFGSGAGDDPLFADCPDRMSVFEWHREGFTLPRSATLLAATDTFPVQAFRLGARAYGILFHLEVNQAMVAAWRGVFGPVPADLAAPRSDADYAAVNQLAVSIAQKLFLR